MKKRRVGLFGGAFDPIHMGHLELAEIALKEGRFDKVIFIPSSNPPHKDELFASFEQRAAMTSLAIEASDHFDLSRIEQKMDGISYTFDMLEHLQLELSEEDELFFLIGTDAFLEIESWKLYEQLFKTINFFIIKREDDELSVLQTFLDRLGYERCTDGNWVYKNSKKHVIISESMPVAISSSSIRTDLKKGVSSIHLCHDVLKFIKEEKIYSTN